MNVAAMLAAPVAAEYRNCAAWFAEAIAIERDALSCFLAGSHPVIPRVIKLIAAQTRPMACIGMGKSGLIAAKLAATFSSLGTAAFHINAAEAAHGDLGMVQPGSTVLLISNSGTTAEILRILPSLQARGCMLIGITGRAGSPIARAVDLPIVADVAREADNIDLAPTASALLHMAIGDAIAIAVARVRGFTRDDFARHHPAGRLGHSLMPVASIMRSGTDVPVVLPSASATELLITMSAQMLGAACVIDHDRHLIGLVVDGDIRRHILANGDLARLRANDVMQPSPSVIGDCASVSDAVELMRTAAGGLLVLPVVDARGRLAGILHANDLMRL